MSAPPVELSTVVAVVTVIFASMAFYLLAGRMGRYVHRGLEKAAERRPWVQNIYMFERTCPRLRKCHVLGEESA